MTKDTRQVSILDKETISTTEVVLYLESLNLTNAGIMEVLMKEPILPGYEELDWFVNSKVDITITTKLKNHSRLNMNEKTRLKEMLLEAVMSLRKLRKTSQISGRTESLEEYITKL